MTTVNAAPLHIRLIGAGCFFVISSLGIILNALLICVLYKWRNSFQKSAFFMISCQLIMADSATHLAEFLVPIPVTIAGYNIYGKNAFYRLVMSMETLAYNSILFFGLLMTINRITVCIFPKINVFLFKEHLNEVILSLWSLLITFVVAWNLLAVCHKSFNTEGFYYAHNCPKFEDIGNNFIGYWCTWLAGFFSYYIPMFMFMAYILITAITLFKLNYEFYTWGVRRAPTISSKQNMKLELKLLAQGFLICGLMEAENLIFNFMPSGTILGNWAYVVKFSGSCLSLLLCCAHPIILFTFNRDIRGRLKRIFRKRAEIRVSSIRVTVRPLRVGTLHA